jgi:[protein-PII] uridylyltransferase
MSWTAQKEDISDTEVVERFSVLVKDQTHLDNLYLLTIADMMGTNPYVWNDWKSQLLLDLYLATSRTLRRGLSNPELMSEVVLIRKNEALQQPTLQAYSKDVITTFWEQVDQDYFVRYTADTIAWLTETLISAPLSELPLVTVRDRYEGGALQYLVCASASDTLFSQITATFDRHHMNIVDARVHSIRSGLALYLIVVLPTSGDERSSAFLNLQTRDIRRHLLERKRAPQPRSVTLPRTVKQFPIEPLVTFTTTPTDSNTIMELTAQDHPGLLHQVAKALLENKVLLTAAKVSTVGERAEDVFYLTDRDGQAINNPDIQKRIADTIAVNLSAM